MAPPALAVPFVLVFAVLQPTPGPAAPPAAPIARPVFTDVSAQAGLDVWHTLPAPQPIAWPYLGGGAVGDFDNDGWQDFLFLAGGGAPDRLFINNADGTFTDQAPAWNIADEHLGVGAVAADFNNDGYLDVYVTSLGAPGSPGQIGSHRLYINNGPDPTGQHSFTDAAAAAGVNLTGRTIPDGFSAAAGDYDLDGDLDLAVAGWYRPVAGNALFRNDGTDPSGIPLFTNVTAILPADMLNTRGFSPSFVDTDDDWYPELLWVSDYSTSKYFVNNTDGTFSEQTAAAGVGLDQWGMGNTQGDFDNDGRLDWYVTSIYDIANLTLSSGNKLYMNLGAHTFLERAAAAGADDGGWGWGVVAVDLDNDTDLDIAQTNGWPDPGFVADPSKVFLNDGDANFTESAAATGFVHTAEGRGLARIDYDNDGDQDIIIISRNSRITLFRNDQRRAAANWLRVFIDTSTRPDLAPHGVGARVRAVTPTLTQHRYVDVAGHFLCSSEHSVHFGLAHAQTVTLEVEWHDGTLALYKDIPANQTLTVVAPDPPVTE